jgi:hypothetical protein
MRVDSLEHVAGNRVVVGRDHAHALALGSAIPQVVRLLHVLAGRADLAHVVADQRERRIGRGELRVHLDGAQEIRHAGVLAMVHPFVAAERVGLQRHEGRGCHLVERARVPVHRGERFAELGAQSDRRLVERLQHFALAVRACLLGHQDVAVVRAQRMEPDHVVVTQREDAAGDRGLRAGAMLPVIAAFEPARWQISSATSPITGVPAFPM